MIARRLALLRTLARIGPRRIALVAQHRRRLKSGYYEKACPVRDWGDEVWNGRTPFVPVTELEIHPDPSVIEDADRIVAGELKYFSWCWLPKPPTWRSNPATGFITPKVHWSKLDDFDEAQGDIKWIWEPSRFEWAVTLGRAYALTRDEKYRTKFAELLVDWRAHNRPNEGVNWYCPQECSLRMLVLIWAAAAFDVGLTNLEGLIWSTVVALAERILPSIDYAIGQFNNHGISEAMGLYMAGMCLEHPNANGWRRTGYALLVQSIDEQFEEDGSYVQNSFVYQRLAMQACLACFHAAHCWADSFPTHIEDRVLKSAELLRQMMPDPTTGRVPNYGANDGARLLPLSPSDYLDFRPIIQLASAVIRGLRSFERGPWDDDLAWYGLSVMPVSAWVTHEGRYSALKGGYHILRYASNTFAFIRSPHYRGGRPSQADALHVDVWLDGQPVAIDSGTYSYNDPDGWWKHFKSTYAHNTVVVDELDQMPSAGRFLFTHWTKTRERALTPINVTAESYAYRQVGRGVTHERSVEVGAGYVVVIDRLRTRGNHQYELSWHLEGLWRLDKEVLIGPGGVELHVTCNHPFQQFALRENMPPESSQSLRYGELTEAPVLVATTIATGYVQFVSIFKSEEAESGVLSLLNLPPQREPAYAGHGGHL